METIRTNDGGTFNGYLAKPAKAKAAGILVIQEIFGINHVMRDLCDAFAADGYYALCPDLFWRQKPGVDLDDHKKEDWDQAFKYMNGFDLEKGLSDLDASANHLHEICDGKIGAVGYCLGGRLAFLMAARPSVDCAVSYYGVALTDHLNIVPKISKPLLMHIAGQDKFMPEADRQKVLASVKANPHITPYVYENVDHAFARVGGDHYDAAAAKLANDRTKEFLHKNLG